MTETSLNTPDVTIDEHDCPYAGRLEQVAQRNRSSFYPAAGSVARILAEIHTEGHCPPTHIDSSPTIHWSNLVRDTKA